MIANAAQPPSFTPSGRRKNLAPPQAPDFLLRKDGGRHTFEFSGDCVVLTLDQMPKAFAQACREARGSVCFNVSGLGRLDSSGARFLLNAMREMERRGVAVTLEGLKEESAALVERVAALPSHQAPRRSPRQRLLYALDAQGRRVVDGAGEIRDFCGFWGMVLVRLVACLTRPWKIRWVSVVAQLDQAGVRAVPIVALLTFLIGLVVAYMGADQLARVGASIYIVDLVSIASLRELAVLIMSIIVAGRSGSAFTAQIGSMVAHEEVSAMRTLGLDPLDVLVLPRVIALAIALPFLTIIADAAALLGGIIAAYGTLDITPGAFIDRFYSILKLKHFFVGLIKAPVFALLISAIGCFQGFRVTGSAESVGQLTTRSVVHSIFLVILADALFALLFLTLGI